MAGSIPPQTVHFLKRSKIKGRNGHAFGGSPRPIPLRLHGAVGYTASIVARDEVQNPSLK